MDAKIMPVTSFRPQLLQCMNRIERLGEEYVITRNGEPKAVMMSFEEWESWKETLDILKNKRLVKNIQKRRKYFAQGKKGVPLEKVFDK